MNFLSKKIMPLFWLALGILLFSASHAVSADVPRMGVDELKGLLGSENVLILDARAGKDWNASEFKIKGAIRTPSSEINSWIAKIPKDKILVVYCA